MFETTGNTAPVLYLADPKLNERIGQDRNADFRVVVHHADGVGHQETLALEAAFIANPHWRTARDFLWAAFDDLEPYMPDQPVGAVRPSSGFVPTGRILVVQGRALPEFSEVYTTTSYSAFCLAGKDSGWDTNEFTGDVLRDAGLNGMGFPMTNFGGPYDPLDDLDGAVDWEETVETIRL